MGQMSSQSQSKSAEVSAPEYQWKSKDKRGRSRKSKRKSAGMERPIDQEEEESALTLMQMSEAPIQHSRAPYYEDNQAHSARLVAENSPIRPSTELVQKSKSRKTSDKRRVKKRRRTDVYGFTSIEEQSNGAEQYPDLSSIPTGQIDRSSLSPYRPNMPLVNALDEIPTDDDDVAAYEEYAKGTASADTPGLPDHDMLSFSQEPPNSFDHDEIGKGMHASHQVPTSVYPLPQSAEKQKKNKKKKRRRRTDDQEISAHEQGQHIPHSDPEAFDDLFEANMSSANLFNKRKGNNIPIDPELHRINALPPSANSSNLTDGDYNSLQRNGKGSSRHGSSQPRKRRRLEELQRANTTDLPYMSPYSFQHEQEIIKDQVLPGFEDMQRQSYPGLGSPFLDNAADRDPDFSGDGLQIEKSVRRKKKGENKSARSKNEHKGSQKGDTVERAKKDKAENGGAFSAVEGLKLDAFRDNYCEANDMTIWNFNSMIQTPMRGNAQVTALFNDIYDVLPYRPRMSVQKVCRRRFHNFTRGAWNAEEDEMMKDLVAEKGKLWKEIGDSLGRMAEDCRDRWRNYLVNSGHRNREQWTDAEVVNLCTAILECLQLMKEDRMRTGEGGEDLPEGGTESDQEVEDMKHINWQSVSDRMGEHGGGRSRLQCSFKWGQLKKREQADYLKAIRESRVIEKKEPTIAKNPWRMKLSSKKVANMKPGDVYALVQAVMDANVPEEGNIPWKSLGDDQLRTTWNSTDKKVAWSRLKNKVAGSESMGYRSVANELLSRILDHNANVLDERWDPEMHGDLNAKRKYNRRKGGREGKEQEGTNPTNHYMQNSNEYVDDSDDVDGDAEGHARLDAFEPQGFHRYNALSMADDIDGGMNATNNGVVGSFLGDDEDDIFSDARNANGHLPIADGDVSPEFAGRLQSALNAYT